MKNIDIEVNVKTTVEGCNGHTRDDLFDDKGNLKPLKEQKLYYIRIRGYEMRLCEDCKKDLLKKLK